MNALNPVKTLLRPTTEVRRGPTIFAMWAAVLLGGVFWIGAYVFFIVAYADTKRPVGLFPTSVWLPAIASSISIFFSTWQEGSVLARSRLVGADVLGLAFSGLGFAAGLFTLVTSFLEPFNCRFDILASNVERVALCENAYVLTGVFVLNCVLLVICFLNGAVSIGSLISLTGRSLNPLAK